MELPDDVYDSFTPHRQEGVTQNPRYYARNAYWKPPKFNNGDVLIHPRTGIAFKRLTDPTFLEHLDVGREQEVYYMHIPTGLDGDAARHEIVNGPIVVYNKGKGNARVVLKIMEFFLDGPRRKTGYVISFP